MDEQLTVVTRKGQITVPAAIRRALDLQIGDRVAISIEEADPPVARLRPVRSIADATYGVFRGARASVDPEQAIAAAWEEVAENAAREGFEEA